jgi:hypothetical protein
LILAVLLTAFSPQLRAVAPALSDVYDDEVIDAVAEYSLDSDGTLYEEHSPQTELPRLLSPKT